MARHQSNSARLLTRISLRSRRYSRARENEKLRFVSFYIRLVSENLVSCSGSVTTFLRAFYNFRTRILTPTPQSKFKGYFKI
jgi:hypothetical protein